MKVYLVCGESLNRYYSGHKWGELLKLDPQAQGGDEVQYGVEELELV